MIRLLQHIFSIVAFTITAGLASSVATAQTEFKLTASDAATGDYFGLSTSIAGDNAVVGAYNDDDGTNSGSAYVFDFGPKPTISTSSLLTFGEVAVSYSVIDSLKVKIQARQICRSVKLP